VLGYVAPYHQEESFGSPIVLQWEIAQPAQIKEAVRAASIHNWRQAVQKNYSALLQLHDGWDGYRGKRISGTILNHADRILTDALAGLTDPLAPFIIPGADGSLQIEWNNADYEFEFCLSEGSDYSTWIRNRETGREIESDGSEALNLLFRWAPGMASPSGDVSDVPPEEKESPVFLAA
jgi:hypothetical protein